MQLRATLCSIWLLLGTQGVIAAESAVAFMYHRFGEERYPSTNIQVKQLEAQLDYLAENGFTVLPIGTILDHLIRQIPLPEKSVAITIDDAYLSVYEVAYPIFKRRQIPFAVFVTTDPVDRALEGYMNWEQMREMLGGGASFYNHAQYHNHLLDREEGENEAAWLARIEAEINHAQGRLEKELGVEQRLFAYPYGEYDRRLAGLIDRLGYIAFGQHSGAIGPYSDQRALPRFPMNETYANLEGFAQKAHTLPMEVFNIEPWDPLIKPNTAPALTVTLHKALPNPGALNCFINGNPDSLVVWLDEAKTRFRVHPKSPLPEGRSRYNCTAPSREAGRYFWFSQPWLAR